MPYFSSSMIPEVEMQRPEVEMQHPEVHQMHPEVHQMHPEVHQMHPEVHFPPPEAENRHPEAKKRGKEETTPSFGHPSGGGEFLKFSGGQIPKGWNDNRKRCNKKIKSRRDDIFYDYAAPAELVDCCGAVISIIMPLLRSLNEIISRRDERFIDINTSTPSDCVCHPSMRGIFEIHCVTESRRDDIFYDYAAPAELE